MNPAIPDKQLSINSDTFCLMPWIHFHMDTAGKVKACCSTSITYGQLSAKSDDRALLKIWNGRSANAFRKKLLAGEKDKRCSVCYEREAAQKSSMRTETLQKYAMLKNEVFASTDSDGNTSLKPYYLDLRFSNVCNLRCRTCWHGASSSWFEEAKILRNQIGEQAIIKATTDNQLIINKILDFADGPVELYFAGGEPLLMDEHYTLLNKLILQKKNEVFLRYNTNLSIISFRGYDICELWKQFKYVKLSVSVDALQELGGYIRKGLKWNNLIENFKFIQKECPHIQFEIAPTISVFNVFSITKLHQYFVAQGLITINNIYLNLLNRPRNYNIQILSPSLKSKAKKELLKGIEWLKGENANREIVNEYQSILDYMEQVSSSDESKLFGELNDKLDQMRNEDITEYLPFLSE